MAASLSLALHPPSTSHHDKLHSGVFILVVLSTLTYVSAHQGCPKTVTYDMVHLHAAAHCQLHHLCELCLLPLSPQCKLCDLAMHHRISITATSGAGTSL